MDNDRRRDGWVLPSQREAEHMWNHGDQIVVRNRNGGRISWVAPVTVVEDSATTVALYLAAGTPIKHRVRLDGSAIARSLSYEERAAIPWRLGDGIWHNSVLLLVRPGTSHAVRVFWSGSDHAFLGWYVDLQAPLVRTSVGFDSIDHVLDIVVAPDGSWCWKDEDEFAAAQNIGRFTAAEAIGIRREGEAVIAAVERREWPFDTDWAAWRPDPAWTVPPLPENWDAV